MKCIAALWPGGADVCEPACFRARRRAGVVECPYLDGGNWSGWTALVLCLSSTIRLNSHGILSESWRSTCGSI